MKLTPDIVQVVPHENHTVSVFFCDGKTVLYETNCIDIDPETLYALECSDATVVA